LQVGLDLDDFYDYVYRTLKIGMVLWVRWNKAMEEAFDHGSQDDQDEALGIAIILHLRGVHNIRLALGIHLQSTLALNMV
jgi:hypothetical protein